VDDFASFVFYIRLSRETCRGVEILRRAHLEPVMWSETVGLSLLGQDRSETKKSVSVLVLYAVVLVLQVWYCFVKNDLVTLVVIMILMDTATFQVLFIVSLFCAWNITTEEINSGVHLGLLKS